MAEMQRAVGVNVELLERLVTAHINPQATCKLSWSILRGRYVRSDLPHRLAVPQTLFGIPLWWTTIGEFTDNIGFRLEIWEPSYRERAEALTTAYNAQTTSTKLELSHLNLYWPVADRVVS
jgi:hypothetical protein